MSLTTHWYPMPRPFMMPGTGSLVADMQVFGLILLVGLAVIVLVSAIRPRTPVLRGLYWWRAGSGTNASGVDQLYLGLLGAVFLLVAIYLFRVIFGVTR